MFVFLTFFGDFCTILTPAFALLLLLYLCTSYSQTGLLAVHRRDLLAPLLAEDTGGAHTRETAPQHCRHRHRGLQDAHRVPDAGERAPRRAHHAAGARAARPFPRHRYCMIHTVRVVYSMWLYRLFSCATIELKHPVFDFVSFKSASPVPPDYNNFPRPCRRLSTLSGGAGHRAARGDHALALARRRQVLDCCCALLLVHCLCMLSTMWLLHCRSD